ncbi:MAG: V-type ATP synthase subunit F [Dehalococcoidia bacterium]|nr:V-type ATP synthase subunit F [Dehalococcoidia bacterium]
MTSIKHMDIGVIGDEELVNALRLAGISKHYMMDESHDLADSVRKALTELLADPDVGIVIILENYAQRVQDLVDQVRKRKGVTPVIVEVPSKSGTMYPNVRDYYRTRIRQSIGFEVEL